MRNASIVFIILLVSLGMIGCKSSSSFVTEPTKKVPVVYDVDVVVAGGGLAGMTAAIAAAREGASVVLIDRFGTVGGNIGPGMNTPEGELVDRSKGPWKKGAPQEYVLGDPAGLQKEYIERFLALKPDKVVRTMADANISSYLGLKMLKEAGVELMLSTYVADPILKDGKVCGVFVENKSGRQAVKAKVVIDGTGEADLARRAGASILYPKKSYNELDPHAPTGMGIWALLGGIDWDKCDFDKVWECRKVEDIGGLAEVDSAGLRSAGPEKNLAALKVQLVRPHEKVDASNGQHISTLEAGVRMYTFESVQRIRENVPGCEKAYLMFIAPYLGVRGGPCIDGVYTLTFEDCLEGKQFDDVICIYGQAHAMRIICKQGDCKWVDVPYRVMIPEKLDGLIAVGRSASCTPDTLLRQRDGLMYIAQAGGTAAAMAAQQGVQPRDIDVKELQKKLLKAGYYLGDEDRLKELNLNVAQRNKE